MQFLNGYCERAGDPGLWAEPFNALTNLAFLLAAVLAWREAWRRGLAVAAHWYLYLPVTVIFIIGLGSGAWHLVPMRWTLLADVLPITIFIHFYLGAFLVRMLGFAWWAAVLIVAGFFAAGLGADALLPPGALNGTAGYLPAFAAMLALTAVLFVRNDPFRHRLLAVLLVWTVSLTFRTVDRDICEAVAFGTHGFWHLLNALVLYLLMSILIRNDAARANRS